MKQTDTKKRQTRKVGVAGGFVNQMMGNNITLPVVGKGATLLSYSDRSAYEVIETNEDQSSCVIRQMNCKYVGSGYGDEQYEYTSDENGCTSTVEWSEKKQCWGITYKKVEVIKALLNRLFAEFSYNWSSNLPNGVKYDDLIEGEYMGVNTKLKLVKGITKEYKKFHKQSIIFGVMEQYRDPSF